MELKTLRTALAVGLLAITSGYALQAHAAPNFTFTEYGGFTTDVGSTIASYSNLVSQPSTVNSWGGNPITPNPVYSTMSWVANETPQSSLVLQTAGAAALPLDTWVRISTLTHNNLPISSATNWAGQNIWGRFIVTDNDGTPAVKLDNDEAITLSFVETPNDAPCSVPTPNLTTCDDSFTFTLAGLDSLPFSANDGTHWLAEFRFANLTGATQIGDTVYTGENQSSSLDVVVRVSQVPEPATLALLGAGLLGLGLSKRRQLNR